MYYAGVLCHKLSPSHIISVYTSVLSQLPWNQLKPDKYVLHSMIQVHVDDIEMFLEYQYNCINVKLKSTLIQELFTNTHSLFLC
jgi:uncharacterized protein (DUF1499 family)